MFWLQISLAALSLINLVFILGAAYLLNEILRTNESAKNELVKAAQLSAEGAQSLLVAARRSVGEMERLHQAHLATERSSASAIQELNREVKALSDLVQSDTRRSDGADRRTENEERIAEDARAKLRTELNLALATSHRLEEEIAQVRYRYSDISQKHSELEKALRDSREARQEQVQSLLLRQEELEAELAQAWAHAKAAERHVEDNARLLDDLREQRNLKDGDGTPTSVQPSNDLVQDMKDQAEAMMEREKRLLEKIAQIEDALNRNLTEKAFIEEHYVRLTRDTPGTSE